MVLVLCLNAAIDKTAALRRLVPHRRHKLGPMFALPGGKGINVARALARMGGRPLVLGFVAGHSGRFIEEGVRREGLPARWVRLGRGESRVCLSLLDGRDGPTEINEAGPRVTRSDMDRLTALYRRLLQRARLVVLSGSLPAGCPPGAYATLIRLARREGKPVLLDTSEEPLARALSAGPDMVKVNREEAASLGLSLADPAGWRSALKGLKMKGAREAIVTLGAEGAVGWLGGRALRAVPPSVRAVTPIGCGDTFLAGVARSLLRGEGPEGTLAYATAVATASARVLGAGIFRPGDVPGVLRRTAVRRLA